MQKHSGGCQCGAVRFVSTGEPVRAMACHCTTCKQRTGAPYGVGVYFEDSAVEFEGGSLASFEFKSDTTDRWIRNEFCRQCGSTVSWTLEMRPGLRAIAGGSYDDPDWYQVEAHIWTRSARSDMCYPPQMKVCEQALV
ncbi:MAG: GFA family protein [Pseudomonadota bacterium]